MTTLSKTGKQSPMKNMKTTVRTSIYLLFVLLTAACSNEDFISTNNNTTAARVSVYGTFAESSNTRMAYTVGETSISCSWVTGDTIAIVCDTQTTPLLYTATADSTVTDFQPLGDYLDGEDGDVHYAWYPYQASSADSYPSATLPAIAQQSYSEGTLPASLDFVHSTATQSDNNLQFSFSHLFAFLRISVYSEELSDCAGLVITSTEGIAYADGATYDLVNDTIDATLQNSIIYTIDDEALASGRKLHCYVAILPTTSESVITVSKLESDGTVGDALLTKNAPDLGFRASHVYATTIESEDAERYALIALYKSTNGDDWTDNEGWCSDSDLSSWTGITTSSNHVTKLALYKNNLTGEIPEEIEDLTYLTALYLYGNELTGEIPSSICDLSSLKYLYLYDNELTGEIPEDIGNLTKLYHLELHNNNLTGEIPSSIGSLSNLQYLFLRTNELTGEIPEEIGNLSELTYLYLQGNELTGEIPSSIGNLSKLTSLRLYSNELTGEIPSTIGNLTKLYSLELQTNNLTGEIPSSIGNLSNLQGLYLYGNELTGEIPEEIGDLSQLRYLSLYSNELTGEIPSSICNLSNLQYLYLHNNELTGEIPEGIGNIGQLTYLYLYGNELTGEIPSSIGNLSQLVRLYLYNNALTGEIPSSIVNLSQLTYLSLYGNELTGEIPEDIGDLTNLVYLRLDDNNLTGNLPTSMANLTALETIRLYKNCLSGTIPNEIIACSWWAALNDDFSYILPQQNGYGLLLPYKLHDYTVHTLQEHSKGLGIKIVIMGEAYTQSLIDDGTYAEHVGWAYNNLFVLEPYTTFKDYFDVYYVEIPSEDDEIGGDTAFGVYYETERNAMTVDEGTILVRDILSKLEETYYSYYDITTVVLVHTSLNIRSITYSTFSTGFSAGYCTVLPKSTESSLGGLVNHEALGHGFGKLADEYVEYETTIPDESIEGIKTRHTLYNARLNVDVTADPDSILWSYFISDSRYANEGIGVYEGASLYQYGVYRSTETSIMKSSSLSYSFNAPSRQSIYRRIMELSGEGYSFENFIEYDEVNREAYSSGLRTRIVETDREELRGAPPVEID